MRMDWGGLIRDKAQGSTDAAFWNVVADEIERKDAAIAELVEILECVMRYVNSMPPTVDLGFFQIAIDDANAAITKFDNTRKVKET